jgi:hypothetical protein
VKIGGIDCVLQSVTDTQVVCVTGARNAGSIDTKVELQINGGGNAQQVLQQYPKLKQTFQFKLVN